MDNLIDIDESMELEELDLVDDTLESAVSYENEALDVELEEETVEENEYLTALITENTEAKEDPFKVEENDAPSINIAVTELDSPETEDNLEDIPEESEVKNNIDSFVEEEPQRAVDSPVVVNEESNVVNTRRVNFKEADTARESIREEGIFDDNYVSTDFNDACNCVFAKNEKVIRAYELIKKHPDSCIITNKRLIVNGPERVEVAIDKVSGVKSVKYTEIKWFKLLVGGLFLLLCLFSFFFDLNKYVSKPLYSYLFVGGGAILGIIGLIMVIKSIHRKFGITIFTDAMSDIATFRKGLSFTFSTPTTVCVGKRGKDFEPFLQEFGAIILNIRSRNK